MIWRLRPLAKTLRFEANRSYFKGLHQITNYRKYICQTLAMYLHYSKQDLDLDKQDIVILAVYLFVILFKMC